MILPSSRGPYRGKLSETSCESKVAQDAEDEAV
jgi:hypothetical protein